MKKLQCNFTTPEQSKRLLELGVPADSADCFWFDEKEIFFLQDKLYSDEAKDGELVRAIDYTPCWSVGRLIEIYHICDSPGCSFTFHVCFTNLINEIIYKIAEAKSNGWLNLKKLEE